MHLIDSHCHLYLKGLKENIPAVLKRAHAEGVARIICPAIDLNSAEECLSLAQENDSVFAAVGVHPNYTSEAPEDYLEQLRILVTQPKVVAIGEIGLDYYRDHSPRETQRRLFREQLAFTQEIGLPVIIHNRHADKDVVKLIHAAGVTRGVAHCFSSDLATAKAFLELGFYISFAGNLTYKNSPLPEIAGKIPLERTLVETDAPFLSPAPFRSKPNEPGRTRLVAEKLAEIHSIDLETVAEVTSGNAAELFQLEMN